MSTVTHPLYHNRVHGYLFSVSDNNETETSMETESPNMALLCVHSTSVTNCQNLLPFSAKPSLNTLSDTLPSDNSREEITSSRFLGNSSVSKIPSKYSIEKKQQIFLLLLKKLIISREREIKQRRNTVVK